MKRFLAVLTLAMLVVFAIGCSSENTVKDPDRVIVQYQSEMWNKVAVIASGLGADAPTAAAALAVVAADGIKASNHLIDTWGPPKVAPPPYTPQNLATAIDASKSAHASIWLHPWALVGYGAMGLLMGLKFAGSFFPGIGTFISSAAGQVVETIATSLVNLKHTADSHPQDTIHLSGIQAELSVARQNPAVESILTKIHVDKLLDSGFAATAAAPASGTVTASGSVSAVMTAEDVAKELKV